MQIRTQVKTRCNWQKYVFLFFRLQTKGQTGQKSNLRVKNATHKRSRQSSKNEKSKNRKSRGKEFNVYWQSRKKAELQPGRVSHQTFWYNPTI